MRGDSYRLLGRRLFDRRLLHVGEVGISSRLGMRAAALEALFTLGILLLLAVLLFLALLEVVVGFFSQ